MPALTATINGASIDVRNNSLHISDTINGRRTCTFDVYDSGSAVFGAFLPDGLIGKTVQILCAATVLFAGLVQDQKIQIEHGTVDDLVLSFTCSDYSALADRHVVFKVFENRSLREIAEEILFFAGAGTETLASDGVDTVMVTDALGATVDGPTIERLILPIQKASAAFDTVAKLTGYSWLIDYDRVLKFRQAGGAAPFDLGDATGNFRFLAITSSLADHRNEQWVSRDIALAPPNIETFEGDGVEGGFFTTRELGATPAILVRTSAYASAVLTFSDVAVDGETVTIAGHVYTFRDALVGADDVLIGATAEECARNLAHAVNAAPAYEDVYFGLGTVAHATCSALSPTEDLTVRFTVAGPAGNGAAVSTTSANAAWSSGTLTGGVDGVETSQTVGVFGQDLPGSYDWYWLEGTTLIHQDNAATRLVAGEFLQVTYRSLFSNIESRRDQDQIDARAILEGTSGLISAITEDNAANDATYAFAVADGLLRKYGKLPKAASYETDDIKEPLGVTLRAGMSQTINVTKYGVNQSFLIESIETSDVEGTYIRRTVTAIGFPDGIGEPQGNWVDFLGRLFEGGGGGSGSGSSSAVADFEESTAVTINGVPVTY